MEELLYRDSLSCGTAHLNHKGMPKAVCKAKLKPGQCCFRRSYDRDQQKPGPLLALKWCGKRDVTMLSTIHTAFEKWTGKNDRTAQHNPIYKPSCIVEYIYYMGGVDLSDQLMTLYIFASILQVVEKTIHPLPQHAHFECTHFEQGIWNSQTRT